MSRQIPTYGLPPEPPPARPALPPPRVVVYLLGVAGGVAGLLAAAFQETLRGGVLASLVVAPAIEEVCKPIGVIFMLERRAQWLRSRGEVVLMAALGALVFATLENLVYVHVYHPRGGPEFVLFRYTVCTGLHLTTSTIFGVGLARLWRRMRHGGSFEVECCLGYFAAATILHAAYNGAVMILEWQKVLEF